MKTILPSNTRSPGADRTPPEPHWGPVRPEGARRRLVIVHAMVVRPPADREPEAGPVGRSIRVLRPPRGPARHRHRRPQPTAGRVLRETLGDVRRFCVALAGLLVLAGGVVVVLRADPHLGPQLGGAVVAVLAGRLPGG